MLSIWFVILAALGLGLLVFIHELGHYFVARRVGIKVEAFGIGFGRAAFTWERKGVLWRLNWIPFGGYVKMAGMEKNGEKQPYEVEGGFFAAKPLDRIKVALAGPTVNIVYGHHFAIIEDETIAGIALEVYAAVGWQAELHSRRAGCL